MSRRRGARRPLRSVCAISLVALAVAEAAVAQPVQPPATDVPPAPIDAVPPPSPFVAPEPPPSAVVADDSIGRLRKVVVIAETDGGEAVPPRGWRPPTDNGGGVSLSHSPGQPLDSNWVQSQFDLATGPEGIRPSDAVALAQLINRAFVTAGFVNSGLLVQEHRPTDGGILNVRLVYGQLESGSADQTPLTVEWGEGGSAGLSESYLRDRFPSIQGQPLSAVELERDFRLLDESPTIRSISAALRPGIRPGEATLHLLVHPADRFDFYTGVSNDRSPSVGGDHVFAGGYIRNLIGGGDLLSAEAGLTRGVEDAQFSYSTPLITPRLALNLRGSFNNAAVIASALAPLDIRAKDRSAEIGLTYHIRQSPLMVRPGRDTWSPSQSLSAGLFLLHRRQKSFLLGEPFSFAPGSVDGRSQFEAVRLSGDFVQRSLSRVIALSVGTTVGLDGTRSDIPGIPNPHRNFVALLSHLNVAQRLGSGFELRGRLTGQYSRGILYSGLRLAIGGANSVRGYRESLFLVDRGVIGSVELARSFSLSGQRPSTEFDWGGFVASVFADAATFRNAGPPQPEEKSISSVGASLTWAPSSAIRASITYAKALNEVANPGKRSLQDRGIHFRVIVHPFGLF